MHSIIILAILLDFIIARQENAGMPMRNIDAATLRGPHLLLRMSLTGAKKAGTTTGRKASPAPVEVHEKREATL